MKTSELTGALLDYWVARAQGLSALIAGGMAQTLQRTFDDGTQVFGRYAPHENWVQGGPIIDRERLNVVTLTFPHANGDSWLSTSNTVQRTIGYGPTPLVAAMRAYVASKFGDTVPDEAAA